MAASRRIVLSAHASAQAARRNVPPDIVLRVAQSPEQRLLLRRGREVRQSRVPTRADGKLYLVRVIVDVGPAEDQVVTVYQTSRIAKYWSGL